MLGTKTQGMWVATMLVLSFVCGFAVEMWSLSDQFWLFTLGVVFPWVLMLTACLAAVLGRGTRLGQAVLAGSLWGSLAALVFILGIFSSVAVGLGERDLVNLGGDTPWIVVLAWSLAATGVAGAVLGTVSGVAVRLLYLKLADGLENHE